MVQENSFHLQLAWQSVEPNPIYVQQIPGQKRFSVFRPNDLQLFDATTAIEIQYILGPFIFTVSHISLDKKISRIQLRDKEFAEVGFQRCESYIICFD